MLSGAVMMLLTLCAVVITPPSRLPDLWPVLISLTSCTHFMLYYLYLNYRILYLKATSHTTATADNTHKKYM